MRAALAQAQKTPTAQPPGKFSAGTRRASLGLAALGLGVIGLWLATNDGSTLAGLLVLAGATILAAAVLLFFLTPGRYLRSEVYEALCLTDVLTLGKLLSSLLVTSRGIYVPASQAGATKLYLPLSGDAEASGQLLAAAGGQALFIRSGKQLLGLSLDPPGLALFRYAQSLGAYFTPDRLERDLRDVLENTLEIATRVSATIEGSTVSVTLAGLASQGMCEAVRKEHPALCSQIGCPVCSLVGCIVADATGRQVQVGDVSVRGGEIRLRLELLGDR